jgi:hypothetical protein
MARKKQEQEQEDLGSVLEVLGLEQEASSSLSPSDLQMMKRIAFQIKEQGMLPEEACEIENVSFSFLKDLAKSFPIITKIIRVSELKYKRMLLEQVSRSARSGDGKVSLWLLERRYPEEFGTSTSRKNASEPERDLLGAALSYIQETNDAKPLISLSSAPRKIPSRVIATNPTKDAMNKLKAWD